MWDVIGAAVLIVGLLVWWGIAFFGGALAEAREKPGWVPGNVEPVVVPDVIEVGRYVHRADGIYLRWELHESPVVEAERLLRGEGA